MNILDTNIILRFLLKDHAKLSPRAKKILESDETYLDEVSIAEVIWVLKSYYKLTKAEIINHLEKFLTIKSIVNPRKNLIQQALKLYQKHSLSYIDCWLLALSKSNKNLTLKTFDSRLSGKA